MVNYLVQGRRIAVVAAHDAGGAQAVLALAATLNPRPTLCLQGPALTEAGRFFRPVLSASTSVLRSLCPDRDALLTGSSVPGGFELELLRQADQLRIPAATFLDHWGFFACRFEDAAGAQLPDEIWVSDHHARRVAIREGLPQERMKLHPNRFHAWVQHRLAHLEGRNGPADAVFRVLYLTQPLSFRNAARRETTSPDELDVARLVAASLHAARLPNLRIRLRVHPLEQPAKYTRLLQQHARLGYEISQDRDILEDIAWSDVTIAVDSTALVFAALARKRAISFIPPGVEATRIPLDGVQIVTQQSELVRHIAMD